VWNTLYKCCPLAVVECKKRWFKFLFYHCLKWNLIQRVRKAKAYIFLWYFLYRGVEKLCAIYVCFANVFWPQRWIKKASGLILDGRQNSFYKRLTCVHFVFSSPKEEENTPESVHSIIDDVTGRCSDDDFDIKTPFRKGNNTVINCYLDIYNV